MKGNKIKRICMVRNSYYPWMQPNRRNATTLVQNGFQVDVICLKQGSQKKRETVNGVSVRRFPIEHRRGGFSRYAFEYLAFFLLAFWHLSWRSVYKRYHAIEVSGMPDFIVFSTLIPRIFGIPVVLNLYDHTPEILKIRFKLSPDHWLVRILRKLEGLSVRWATYCLGTQMFNKQTMVSHGVPDSKISVFYNVPEETWANHHNNNSQRTNGGFHLLTHGSLLEYYGVQTLVRAVPDLLKKIPNLQVRIVGDGDYRSQLEALSESLGVRQNIDFTGAVEPEEIPAYIEEADIGIVTIEAIENPMLPNKLFEYLHIGKPVISAAIPAITAYFDEKSVMFYEPGNEQALIKCVLDLYHNPQRRALIAQNGAALYRKQFDWTIQKNKYVSVYRDLCTGNIPAN